MPVWAGRTKTFDRGREKLDIGDGGSVGLYSAERSLVDIIRRYRAGRAWICPR
jgi:hypothetical protein